MVLVQRTLLHGDVVLTPLPLEVTGLLGRAVPEAVLVVTVRDAGQLDHLAGLHHHQPGLRVYDEEGGNCG